MNFAKVITGVVGAAAIAAALLFTAKSISAQNPESPRHVVKIAGMVFNPQVLHIAPGESVTWFNRDIVMHAMKSTQGEAWQSKDLPPLDSWSRTFNEGVSYICPYHPTMTGRIVVDAPSPNK